MNRHGVPAWAIVALLLAACEGDLDKPMPNTGGKPEEGLRIVAEKGCGGCHVIPGVDDAEGTVGPPLTDFAQRTFIAGHLPNTPDNLVKWLMDPPAVAPHTAMPDLELDRNQAEHVAAWLYTLR